MDLSLNKLKEALALRQEIDTLERRLAALFSRGGSSVSFSGISVDRVRRRRPMSTATRAKLAEAARRRWAQRRNGGGFVIGKVTTKRRGLTAAGRRKLSEAMKARWAARRRAAGKRK